MTATSPIRLAIIGAGRFTQEAHLPALVALGEHIFQIKAMCSRSPEAAQHLAAMLPYTVDFETEIEAVLAREDIDAVDILVPRPEVIEQVLLSGKHLLSENPIAADSATAHALLALQQSHQVWMVAENQRYHPGYQQAADLVRSGEIGRPLLAHYVAHHPMTPDRHLFRASSHDMLLGAGVNHMAALRMTLGEILSVNATTSRTGGLLKNPDTLIANLNFANGLLGHYAVTYATGPGPMLNFTIIGEAGQIQISRTAITIRHSENEQVQLKIGGAIGISAELRAFAQAIQSGSPQRNSPQEALQDLAVIEAMLRSAELEREVDVEPFLGVLA